MSGGDVPTDVLAALGRYAREAFVLVEQSGTLRALPHQPFVLGYGRGSLEGRNIAEMIHPDDLPLVVSQYQQARRDGQVERVVTARVRHADGRWVTLEVEAIDARDDPVLGAILLRGTRLDGPTPDERGLPVARTAGDAGLPGMAPLAEALSSGILAAGADGAVVYANAAVADLLERPRDALLGDGWLASVDPGDADEVAGAAEGVLDGSPRNEVTFRLAGHIGRATWVHGRFSSLAGGDDPAGWVAVLDDVTRQRAAEDELARQATHDALTGLPDRVLLRDRIAQAMARLHRVGEHVAVMFVDIDGFKAVNDEHGHAVGDALLVEIAARLQQAVRPGDTAARVGGDEFVVLADNVDAGSAGAVAARVAAAIARPSAVEGVELTLGVSIGIALSRPTEGVDDVLSRADQAMYRAKRDGTEISMA